MVRKNSDKSQKKDISDAPKQNTRSTLHDYAEAAGPKQVEECSLASTIQTAFEAFKESVDGALKKFADSITKLEIDLAKAIDFQSSRIDILEDELKRITSVCQDNNVSDLQNCIPTKSYK